MNNEIISPVNRIRVSSKNSLMPLLLILVFCINGCSGSSQNIIPVLGLAFPPVGDLEQIQFTLREMDQLNISLIRFEADWEYREPAKGEYNWAPLDERINSFSDSHHGILLTIAAKAPNWACDDGIGIDKCACCDVTDFRDYIRSLVTRYKGKIDKIQFANEWDILSWYSGTAESYTELNNIVYDEVKQISPNTKVVLGGITKTYPLYITACVNKVDLSFANLQLKFGVDLQQKIKNDVCTNNTIQGRVEYVFENARYDIVDIHLYDDCENWPVYLDVVTALTRKPILVSEFGGPSSDYEVYSNEYHAERLKKYIQTLGKLSITEAYYFTLFDIPDTYHSNSGLFTADGKKKEAYYIFERMTTHLDGR